jgi:DNA polymerase (family 10)
MANNVRIAAMLRQIGALLDEQGVAFKPAAYRRAAQVIEDLPNDVSTYGNEKDLEKLPGIGKAIAGKIIEFLETGRMHTLDELLAAQGGIPAELMDVEGLGPKRIRKLQTELGIQNVPDLVAAAKAGKIRDLEGFDEIMEKKLLENAGRVKERITRFSLAEVENDVETLLKAIRAVKGVQRAEVAGSYRRRKPTVGDIDILTVTTDPHKISAAIAALPIVRNVVAHGDKKLSFDFTSGLRVDVRFVAADQWGAAILYFTGSKDHNIAMRKIAIRNGWKLNEYGLFEGDKIIASKTEEDIYKALGLKYYEPDTREGGL